MAINDITGANIISKYSKKFDNNFDSIFRKSDEKTSVDKELERIETELKENKMRSHHDININNGELLWTKHDKSRVCPVDKNSMIEIETWMKTGNVIAKASEVNWSCVKFYREIEPKK